MWIALIENSHIIGIRVKLQSDLWRLSSLLKMTRGSCFNYHIRKIHFAIGSNDIIMVFEKGRDIKY